MRDDRHSGSSEMTERLLSLVDRLCRQERDLTIEDWTEFARSLRDCRPGIATFHNIAKAMTLVIDEAGEEWQEELGRRVDQLRKDEREAGERIAARALGVVHGMTFLTFSYSGTVMRTLELMNRKRDVQVLVAESQPLGEGRLTAQTLSQMGVPVRLLPDSLMAAVIDSVDGCLVGADAVLPQGVLNKVGTKALATISRSAGKPFHVLSSELKVAELPVVDLVPSEESEDGIKKVSQLFDLTPLSLVDHLITEKRDLSPGSLVWIKEAKP